MKTILSGGLAGALMVALGFLVGRFVPEAPVAVEPRTAAEPVAAVEATAARRLEATVLLPLADNQGQPFSESDWQEALAEVLKPFGGATLGQPQEGCWVDDHGRICREPVRPVVVSFAPERLTQFRLAVREVGRRLGQEAMYVRFEEPRVDLLRVHDGRIGVSP